MFLSSKIYDSKNNCTFGYRINNKDYKNLFPFQRENNDDEPSLALLFVSILDISIYSSVDNINIDIYLNTKGNFLPETNLSLKDINKFLNKQENLQISLNDKEVRDIAVKPNGLISFNDLKGKTTNKKCSIEIDAKSLWDTDFKLYINNQLKLECDAYSWTHNEVFELELGDTVRIYVKSGMEISGDGNKFTVKLDDVTISKGDARYTYEYEFLAFTNHKIITYS